MREPKYSKTNNYGNIVCSALFNILIQFLDPSLTDFALCFEAPIPSNSSNSNRGGSGWTFPSNNGNGGPQEGLPMLAPLDATPLNTSFPTPVFNTPPNSGLPPPYVQPRPTLGQNFLTPPNSGPPPPYVQPTLGRPLKTPPSLQTPPNHGLPPGSGDSERPLGSASSNSFLTPGMTCTLT